MARKVAAIHFRMDTLHKRSGTTRPLRMFAFDIRKMAETQPLPEYGIRIERDSKHELVILHRDRAKPRRMPRGMPKIDLPALTPKQLARLRGKA